MLSRSSRGGESLGFGVISPFPHGVAGCVSQHEDGLGLDLLRCESLNSLDAATCMRVLQKNYAVLISMVPLSKDVRSVQR